MKRENESDIKNEKKKYLKIFSFVFINILLPYIFSIWITLILWIFAFLDPNYQPLTALATTFSLISISLFAYVFKQLSNFPESNSEYFKKITKISLFWFLFCTSTIVGLILWSLYFIFTNLKNETFNEKLEKLFNEKLEKLTKNRLTIVWIIQNLKFFMIIYSRDH